MIIDTHVHIWERNRNWAGRAPQLSYGKINYGDGLKYCLPPAFRDSVSSPEVALAYMEISGIDQREEAETNEKRRKIEKTFEIFSAGGGI